MVLRLLPDRTLRLVLAGPGRLSRGVRLGQEHGFDSAISLEYAYANRAHGRWGIDVLADRYYLSRKGWRAIRIRRQHVERCTIEAIKTADAKHLLELGAGCGAGGWAAAPASGRANLKISLQDIDAANLAAAQHMAIGLGLGDVLQTRVSDAFGPDPLPGLGAVDVAVVSGLYELFDDAAVKRSLASLGAGMSRGGTLMYSGNPWHPQARMMTRHLPSQRGGTCDFTRRTQEELEQLMGAAGFKTTQTLSDPWGIFTVGVGLKV